MKAPEVGQTMKPLLNFIAHDTRFPLIIILVCAAVLFYWYVT